MLDRLPRSRTDAATFTQVNPGERQEKTKGVRSDVGNEAKNMDTSESPSRITTQPVAASPTNKRVPSSMNMSTVDSIPSSLPSARSNSSQKTPTPRSTITVLIASSQTSSPRTSIISVPTGGTRVLPEASQSRSPDLSMQNRTAITLSPTISGLPSSTPLIQGIALARPLPGKNQGRPILDAVAVPSYLELAGPESKSVPTISQTVVEAEYPFTSSQWSSSTSCGSNSTVLFMPVPTPTSFVTLTRDEQYKEQVSASFDATQDAPTPSAAKPTSILNPSALVTTLIAATPTVPLNVAASAVVNLQESRRLTPVTRTLFIVFGVLGALALLVAFGVVLLMRAHKNRSGAKVQQSRNWPSDLNSRSSYSSAARISAYRPAYENPFLTESEKGTVAEGETTLERHEKNDRYFLPPISRDL